MLIAYVCAVDHEENAIAVLRVEHPLVAKSLLATYKSAQHEQNEQRTNVPSLDRDVTLLYLLLLRTQLRVRKRCRKEEREHTVGIVPLRIGTWPARTCSSVDFPDPSVASAQSQTAHDNKPNPSKTISNFLPNKASHSAENKPPMG
jgi:hypothetical protein